MGFIHKTEEAKTILNIFLLFLIKTAETGSHYKLYSKNILAKSHAGNRLGDSLLSDLL